MATTAEVRALLAGTSLPDELVGQLLAGASATWLMGERADSLAADLALCHPELAPAEVRAIAVPLQGPAPAWRISLLAHDRPGLLARAAGALSVAGLDIESASGTTFSGHDLALLRILARPVPTGAVVDDAQWGLVGERLRAAVGRREPVHPRFDPVPDASVDAMPDDGGRCVVTVRALDRPGLLWRAAAWFEATGCNIETVRVTATGGVAEGSFVVAGTVDPAGLVQALTRLPVQLELPAPARWAIRGATASAVLVATAVRTARRRASQSAGS